MARKKSPPVLQESSSSPSPPPVPERSFNPSRTPSPLPKAFGILVVLLAVALGILFNTDLLVQRPAPPSLFPTTVAKTTEQDLAELVPSTEMCRGTPKQPLQHKLYNKAPPAVLYVLNYESTNHEPLRVFFHNEVKAIAPQQSHARIETFIGHQFHLATFDSAHTLNVTISRPFTVVQASATGELAVLQEITSEAALKQKHPRPALPEFPNKHHKRNLPTSTAKSIKIRNLSGKRFNEYWVPAPGEGDPVYQGVIEPNHEATTNSYIGHTFRFTSLRDAQKVFFEFTVRAEQEVYAYVDKKTADPQKLESHLEELAFAKQYKLVYNGTRNWLSFYPHQPVKTFMWPADYIGQKFPVHTNHGPNGDGRFDFDLEVVSVRPRAYAVEYFISDEECDFIISSAKARLAKSSVEARGANGELVASNTRTSQNAWLERKENATLDRIYRRVADLLNIPEETLWHSKPNGFAESLQVVHYQNSAHYAPHHDWGVHGGPHTRLATVLLYLNEPTQGGSTTFPKAIVGKRDGLEVKPKRGRAVLFYSQHPDGNVDDESLHEATPVTKGEKWLANVWVHDKKYWGRG